MAKPATKRTYLGPWTPENRDQLIDKLVKIAGELPAHQFRIEKREKREVVTYSGSAREKLHSEIEHAQLQYRFAGDGRRRRTPKQLLTELRRIESAAHRLLMLVGRDDGAVRDSTFGLDHSASDEVGRLTEALQQAELMTLRHSLPREMFSPSGRLQTAIEGVEALRRWAKAAAEENLRRIARMRTGEIGLRHGRHRGDVRLNGYIKTMVEECWCGVWGRQISDGPRLWRFVVEAASAVGMGLSEDASRERIRRIFNLRRANRSGLDGDLPNLQTRGSKQRGSGKR